MPRVQGLGLHLGTLHEQNEGTGSPQSMRQALGAGGAPLPCLPPAHGNSDLLGPGYLQRTRSGQQAVHGELAAPWPGDRGRIHCGSGHLPNLSGGHFFTYAQAQELTLSLAERVALCCGLSLELHQVLSFSGPDFKAWESSGFSSCWAPEAA